MHHAPVAQALAMHAAFLSDHRTGLPSMIDLDEAVGTTRESAKSACSSPPATTRNEPGTSLRRLSDEGMTKWGRAGAERDVVGGLVVS